MTDAERARKPEPSKSFEDWLECTSYKNNPNMAQFLFECWTAATLAERARVREALPMDEEIIMSNPNKAHGESLNLRVQWSEGVLWLRKKISDRIEVGAGEK